MNAPPRIMIADDDEQMRELLVSILHQRGYRDIVHASSGTQAYALLADAKEPFDLALLDLEMPGMSGLEVLSACRALLPHCMWVIVSGHSGLPNVLSAISAGAHGFIVKPYSMVKVFDILDKFDNRS